jgi:HAD superfamily hydrolase (TIGR01509 family)
MKITSIIFDMDGVLIDSEAIHKLATQKAFEYFGLTVTEEQYPSRGTPDEVVMVWLSRLFPDAQLSIAELLRLKNAHYEALEHLAAPVPGAVEFVLWAKERYKIGLATMATPRNCQSTVQMLGLQGTFQCIVDRGCVTHPKPAPEAYLIAAAGLGSAPAECLVIEDSVSGVTAAVAAGCKVVALTTSFPRARLIELGADSVVDSYAEISALLT